jgi:CRISPR-associated protein Cmr2
LREVFDGDNLIQAQQALEAFLNSVCGHDRPTPYYALLHADGDNMGKTISVLASIEAHKALSRALSGLQVKLKTL